MFFWIPAYPSVKLSKLFIDVRRTIWRFQYSPPKFYFVKRRKGALAGFNILSADNRTFDFILEVAGSACSGATKAY